MATSVLFCGMESDRTATLVFITIIAMVALAWTAFAAAERSSALMH
jgi:hypothetical protein